jgi:hypothetical protein
MTSLSVLSSHSLEGNTLWGRNQSLYLCWYFIITEVNNRILKLDLNDNFRNEIINLDYPRVMTPLSNTKGNFSVYVLTVVRWRGYGVCSVTYSLNTPSSLMHVHRCIGSRNATRQTLPTSVKLTYLSVYGTREVYSEMVFLSTQLPRRPPPPSRMYTGVSVLETQPGRRCLPLWNWHI